MANKEAEIEKLESDIKKDYSASSSEKLSAKDLQELLRQYTDINVTLKIFDTKVKNYFLQRETALKSNGRIKVPELMIEYKFELKDKNGKVVGKNSESVKNFFPNVYGKRLIFNSKTLGKEGSYDAQNYPEASGKDVISSEMAWAQVDPRFKVAFEEVATQLISGREQDFFNKCKQDVYLARDLVGMSLVVKNILAGNENRARDMMIHFGLGDRLEIMKQYFNCPEITQFADRYNQIISDAKNQGVTEADLKKNADKNLTNSTVQTISIDATNYAYETVDGKTVIKKDTNNLTKVLDVISPHRNNKTNNFFKDESKISKSILGGYTEEVFSIANSMCDKLKEKGKFFVEKVENFSDKLRSSVGLSPKKKRDLSNEFSMDLYREYKADQDSQIETVVEDMVRGLDVSDDSRKHKQVQTEDVFSRAGDLAFAKRIDELNDEIAELSDKFITLSHGEEKERLFKKIQELRSERLALHRLKHGKWLVGEKDDPRLHYTSQMKIITRKELTARIRVNLKTIEKLKASGGDETLIQKLEEENKEAQEQLDSLVITEEEERYAESHKGCSIEDYRDANGDLFAETKTKKKCLEGHVRIRKQELKKLNLNREANKERIEKLEAEIKEYELEIAKLQEFLTEKGKELREIAERDKKTKEKEQYEEINKLFENVKKEENYLIIESVFANIEEIFERHIQDVSLLVGDHIDASVWSKDDVEKVKITWMLEKLEKFEKGIDTYSENPLVRNKFKATISEYKRKLEKKLNKLDKVVIEKPPKTKEDVKRDHIRNIQEYKDYPVRTKIVNGEEYEDISIEQASKAIKKVTNAIIGLCSMKFDFDESQIQMCEEALANAATYLEKHESTPFFYSREQLVGMLQDAKKAFEKAKERILASKTTVKENAEPESPEQEESALTTIGVAGEVSESKLVEEANSFTIVLVGGASKKSPEQQMAAIIQSK